ncbi:MAG: VOC family protein [Proteobacteria bacterium]|nr:VOC family protein [Pseudomonadota bacterium]
MTDPAASTPPAFAAASAGRPSEASAKAGTPLWPAQLDHIGRESDNPAALVTFYRDVMGMAVQPLGPGQWLMRGPQRRILIAVGTRGGQPLSAFRVESRQQLDAVRARVTGRGVPLLNLSTPLFADGFAVRDPDGRQVAFGLPDPRYAEPASFDLPAARLRGRLQHVVVASTDVARLAKFYVEDLGFVVTDNVFAAGDEHAAATAMFLRSDLEHHSFAVFRAPEARPDHHAYETASWNDIRDWADHMAAHRIKLWWGPGRHGAGNNLFFMVEDPDGHKVELSAELEYVARDAAPRAWAHEERTLNLWGGAWMRS